MSDGPTREEQAYKELTEFDKQLAEFGKRGIGQAQSLVGDQVRRLGYFVDSAPLYSPNSHKGNLKKADGGWRNEIRLERILLPNALADGTRVVVDYDTHEVIDPNSIPSQKTTTAPPKKRLFSFLKKSPAVQSPRLPVELRRIHRPYRIAVVVFPPNTPDLVTNFPQWSEHHSRGNIFSGYPNEQQKKVWFIDFESYQADGYADRPQELIYRTPIPIAPHGLSKEGKPIDAAQQFLFNLRIGKVEIVTSETNVPKGQRPKQDHAEYNFAYGKLEDTGAPPYQPIDYMNLVRTVLGDLDSTLQAAGI